MCEQSIDIMKKISLISTSCAQQTAKQTSKQHQKQNILPVIERGGKDDEQPRIERHQQCQDPQKQHNGAENRNVCIAAAVSLLNRMAESLVVTNNTQGWANQAIIMTVAVVGVAMHAQATALAGADVAAEVHVHILRLCYTGVVDGGLQVLVGGAQG